MPTACLKIYTVWLCNDQFELFKVKVSEPLSHSIISNLTNYQHWTIRHGMIVLSIHRPTILYWRLWDFKLLLLVSLYFGHNFHLGMCWIQKRRNWHLQWWFRWTSSCSYRWLSHHIWSGVFYKLTESPDLETDSCTKI